MIAAIRSRKARQYEWALWTPKGNNASINKKKPRWIQIERLSERSNSFSTTSGNVVTPSRKITVKTSYHEAYERNDWIKWRNRVYAIISISESIETAPLALRNVIPEYETSYILELMEFDTKSYIEN